MANGRRRRLSRSAVSATPHVDGTFHAQVVSANRCSGAIDIASGVLGILCAAFTCASDIFNSLECAGNSNHPVEFLRARDSKSKHMKPRVTVSASRTDISGRHMMTTDDSKTFSDSESDVFWTEFFPQKRISAERGTECTPDRISCCDVLDTIKKRGSDKFGPGNNQLFFGPGKSDKSQSGINKLFVGPGKSDKF